MAEGGKRPRSSRDSSSKASGEVYELLSEASGDADELFNEASGDADELFNEASVDADELFCEASGDAEELFSQASGDAYESFCDPCKREFQWKAVEGYCQVCSEYLCKTCLGVHRKQKISLGHAILDKNQMPRGQVSVKSQALCVEVCKTHYPETIRFFCKDHDETGCTDCMTLEHTSCKKDRVQDISRGFQKSREFKIIDQKLQQLFNELEKMEDEMDNNIKNLDTSYNIILQKIASVRKETNEYLDHMEKTIQDEAAQMKTADETELCSLRAEHHALKAEIEVMLETLHDSNVNVNSLFVISKQAKQRMITMKNELNKLTQQPQQQPYEFHISNEIQNILSAKTPLGKLSRKSSEKMTEKTVVQYQKTPRVPIIVTTVRRKRSIIVKGYTDKKDCGIKDCTLLDAERMVITDWENVNVKLIDLSNHRVVSSYKTTNEPRGITALSTDMVAVTLLGANSILVLEVTTTFTFHREIKVNKGCWGIAYKDGKFAVSYLNPGRVHILDKEGKTLHLIRPKEGYEHILSRPYYVTFGLQDPDDSTHDHNNDTVIVSDLETKQVSVVTFGGQIIRKYTHDKLTGVAGVAITADGVLFVCSRDGGCIHAVSPDFKTSEIILYKECPQSITYCETNHTLYISNLSVETGNQQNKILVYDVKYQYR